ncbi:MAG: SCO family protein [Candidatus Kapaibacterium sp.]|jgi:protein SCO1/2
MNDVPVVFDRRWNSQRRRMLMTFVIASTVGLSACTREGQGSVVEKGGQGTSVEQTSLPVIKEAPSFSGIDQSGKAFRSAELKGSMWIASFMFSECQGVCPVMNSTLGDIQELYGIPDLRFVSITVDPQTDTPEILAEYAKSYKADLQRWSFVRMEKDSVRALSVRGFLLSDPVEPSAHSSRYVLVDRQFRIRGYYDCLDSAKVSELKADIERIRSEVTN